MPFFLPSAPEASRACWGLQGVSSYLGLAIGQEEVGSTLVFGRAGAIDEELHAHPLLLLLVHPSDALPRDTALTPGPTPTCQARPREGAQPCFPVLSARGPDGLLQGPPLVRWQHTHGPEAACTTPPTCAPSSGSHTLALYLEEPGEA